MPKKTKKEPIKLGKAYTYTPGNRTLKSAHLEPGENIKPIAGEQINRNVVHYIVTSCDRPDVYGIVLPSQLL